MTKNIFALLVLMASLAASAQTTFRNPMLWADVPDPDVIRVGDTFYLVSTTMHLMPGGPVYESKDLVHWTLDSYLFDRLTDSPLYDLVGGTNYGRGQWATSLRYHNGHFYALFCTNDPNNGDSYVFTTTDPRRGWTLHSRLPHFHDASLFFDDDGRAYVFHGTGMLTELQPDLKGVKKGGVEKVVIERDSEETALLEGSRVVKHNGKYYLLMVSWPMNMPRRQVCYRADRIDGPYEKKIILKSEFGGFSYVGQGTIVDAPDGNWYGVIFQDRGGVGRILTLMPCTWRDGWPMLGDADGKVPDEMPLPVEGHGGGGVVVGDEFSSPKLNINWQWNHNPDASAWSLTEREGWLRLKTNRVVPNVYQALNTLTQRMEGPRCSGMIKMDVSNMLDGDVAGFSAINGDAGMVKVERRGKWLVVVAEEQSVRLTEVDMAVSNVEVTPRYERTVVADEIYFRIDADFRPGTDLATFSYSTDGIHWTTVLTDYKMIFDYRRFFMGSKFAIFNYATKQKGGYVDVDFFRYSVVD